VSELLQPLGATEQSLPRTCDAHRLTWADDGPRRLSGRGRGRPDVPGPGTGARARSRPGGRLGAPYMRPLTLAQVHSALAYYFDHREEIESYFEESEPAVAKLEAERAAYLKQHPDV
jgi:hypothetical protein